MILEVQFLSVEYMKILATRFRHAIEAACANGEFSDDFSFGHFPRACCGDASDLLAQYLLDNGIATYYVCGEHYDDDSESNGQSHAWLKTADDTIIDITGDQFKYDPTYLNYNESVYVGMIDEFHELFSVEDRDVHENHGLQALGDMCLPRLMKLYRIILRYCDEK